MPRLLLAGLGEWLAMTGRRMCGGQGVEREPAAPLLNLRQSHRIVVPVGLGALGTGREVDVVGQSPVRRMGRNSCCESQRNGC